MTHSETETPIIPCRVNPIYASTELMAEYNSLLIEIRALDGSIKVPQPVDLAALKTMRGILDSLKAGRAA